MSSELSTTVTLYDRAVLALEQVVETVVKVDPNGVDILCFGGDDEDDEDDDEGNLDWYRHIKTTKGLKGIVTDKQPAGKTNLGPALKEAIDLVWNTKNLTQRPVSILVITANVPDDFVDTDMTEQGTTLVEQVLLENVQRFADTCESLPLTVTFVKIGTDETNSCIDCTNYVGMLEKTIQAQCAATGEMFRMVDCVEEQDIASAMAEIAAAAGITKPGTKPGLKKFLKRFAKKEKCDYILVLDRSGKMVSTPDE